jgi:hypothetical protein
MARSPDIARRGDRFAYDGPQGAAAQAGGEEPEPIGLRHHFQDLPPCLGVEGVRYLRFDRRVSGVLIHARGEPDG